MGFLSTLGLSGIPHSVKWTIKFGQWRAQDLKNVEGECGRGVFKLAFTGFRTV